MSYVTIYCKLHVVPVDARHQVGHMVEVGESGRRVDLLESSIVELPPPCELLRD